MKLKAPMTADFNPVTRIFTISGVNQLGKSGKVEFAVDDEHVFIGWLVAALHEKSIKDDGSGKALIATGMKLGLHQDKSGNYSISFTFSAGDLKLAFLLETPVKEQERLSAITGHLEQAMSEMGYQQPVVKH